MSEITQAASIQTATCETMFSRTMWLQGTKSVTSPASALTSFGAAAFATIRLAQPKQAQPAKAGGARRDRTDDLMLAKHALSQLSYGPVTGRRMLSSPPSLFELRRDSPRSSDGSPSRSWRSQRRLVGLGRLELPTSRLSSARSNQLSYKPLTRGALKTCAHPALTAPEAIAQAQPLARVRPRRKRNEDGEIPPMGLNNPEIAGP
jgi:hypothetical protein